jgi:hypothetical protein
MVETITPVVHGGRRGRWGASVALHAVGAGMGAAVLGAALGAVGRILGAPWGSAGLWVAAAVAAVYAARELLGLPIPLPDRKEQVPEWWRTFFGPSTAAFLYGLGLGPGFLTYLRHGTLVAVAAVAVTSGSPGIAALLVLPFGLARAVTVLAAAPGTTSRRMEGVMARLDAMGTSAVPRIVNGVSLVLLAVVAAVVAPEASGGEAGSFAAEILAGVFAWAALAKVARFRRWRSSLDAYRLPLSWALAAAVPAAEASITALVLLGRTRVAALAALVLLTGFSMAVLRARQLVGDRVPCGCFGGRSRRDYRVLLARNAALVPVALAALSDPGIVITPGDAEVVPVALLILGVVLLGLLMREVARLTPGRQGSRASV